MKTHTLYSFGIVKFGFQSIWKTCQKMSPLTMKIYSDKTNKEQIDYSNIQ